MKDKRKQVSFALNEDLMDRLLKYCNDKGYDRYVLLEFLIDDYLKKISS